MEKAIVIDCLFCLKAWVMHVDVIDGNTTWCPYCSRKQVLKKQQVTLVDLTVARKEEGDNGGTEPSN